MADGAVTGFAGPHVWTAKGVLESTWAPVTGVTTCLPLNAPRLPDKTVIVHGTWGGATLVIQGASVDLDAAYLPLNDSRGEGNAISFTSDNVVTILENPPFIRAKTTGGTGTSLTVVITSQSTKR